MEVRRNQVVPTQLHCFKERRLLHVRRHSVEPLFIQLNANQTQGPEVRIVLHNKSQHVLDYPGLSLNVREVQVMQISRVRQQQQRLQRLQSLVQKGVVLVDEDLKLFQVLETLEEHAQFLVVDAAVVESDLLNLNYFRLSNRLIQRHQVACVQRVVLQDQFFVEDLRNQRQRDLQTARHELVVDGHRVSRVLVQEARLPHRLAHVNLLQRLHQAQRSLLHKPRLTEVLLLQFDLLWGFKVFFPRHTTGLTGRGHEGEIVE